MWVLEDKTNQLQVLKIHGDFVARKRDINSMSRPTGGAFEGLRLEGTGMPGHCFFLKPACDIDMTELVHSSGWGEVGILLKITCHFQCEMS